MDLQIFEKQHIMCKKVDVLFTRRSLGEGGVTFNF